MSSMFKKKGSLAFKPKIPSARPRPASSTIPNTVANAPIAKNIQEESAIHLTVEAGAVDSKDVLQSTESSEDAIDKVSSNVDETSKHSQASSKPSTNQRNTTEQRHVAQISPNTPDSSVIDANSTDGDEAAAAAAAASAAAPHSSHRKKPIGKEQPRSAYRHQNPTPPPTIQDSLIAPELRDTPSIIESRELAPLVQSTGTGSTQDILSTSEHSTPAEPATKPTAPRTRARRKAAEAAGEDADGAGDAESRPKKRQRKTATQDADDTATPKPPRKRKSSTPSASSKSRRARSLTPVDAETQVVDLQKLKMTDLTKDLHIGKKFSRHDELRDRERQARLKAKLKKDEGGASRDASEIPDTDTPLADQLKSTSSTPAGMATPTPPAAAAAAATTTAGPQFRIVDGQIIVDQSSLVMDRHARANAARGEMETVEENDFTRLITSNSFMNTSKLKGPNIWTDEETELFYLGLRMFGTEFEMISRMFPNKQRRHVKLKYNREERHHPDRITATICGIKTTKIDIDEYKAFTGMEFESVESIEAEHRKIQEGYEAEQKRAADEQAEIMRKKREELFAEDDAVDDEGGKMKKKGKKRGKQAIAYGLNGEPIMT